MKNLFLLFSCFLFLTACGGGGGGSSDTASTTTQQYSNSVAGAVAGSVILANQ
jgi:hypothetical protein